MAIKVKESGLGGIEFFGDVDKKDGKIGSDYPAWYLDAQVQHVKDSVSSLERELEAGVSEKERPGKRAELKQFKEKLGQIESSRPDIDDDQMNEITAVSKSIGASIRDTMFTEKDMETGRADSHREFLRATEPCVVLKSESEIQMAKKIGCRIFEIKGKPMLSRNDASRVYKICRRLMDEDTDVETLRKRA